jgi:hypothetical protein
MTTATTERRRNMTTAMFITLVGDPQEGFLAFGPYATNEEACEAGDCARCEYGGADWNVFELPPLSPAPARRTAREWRLTGEAWVRVRTPSGRLDSQWEFAGPYDQDRPRDPMMLQLQPLGFNDELDERDELSSEAST